MAQQPGRKLASAFPRTERGMARFRSPTTLQRFAAAHASVHNHFNHERHLTSRKV